VEDLDETERDHDNSAVGRAPRDVAQATVQIQRPVKVPIAEYGLGHDVAPHSVRELLERLGRKLSAGVERPTQLLVDRLGVVLVQEVMGIPRVGRLVALERARVRAAVDGEAKPAELRFDLAGEARAYGEDAVAGLDREAGVHPWGEEWLACDALPRTAFRRLDLPTALPP